MHTPQPVWNVARIVLSHFKSARHAAQEIDWVHRAGGLDMRIE